MNVRYKSSMQYYNMIQVEYNGKRKSRVKNGGWKIQWLGGWKGVGSWQY